MTANNMNYWNAMSRPPKEALKTIGAGRLKGMTDISPQWRYEIMTETFGMIGIGWYTEITDKWTEMIGSEIGCFVNVNLYVKVDGEWSKPIAGTGGSRLATVEKKGKPEEYVYVSDEAFKMAYTDALSVAMKMIGVAADIYAGLWDGSKYRDPEPSREAKPEPMTDDQREEIKCLLADTDSDEAKFFDFLGVTGFDAMTQTHFTKAVNALNKKRGQK